MESIWTEIQDYFEQERFRLSPGAFLVWVILLSHSQPYPRMAEISLRELLRKSGIKSRSTILGALRELERNRMLSKIRADKKYSQTNLYLLRADWKNPD